MALSSVEKTKALGYIKNHVIGQLVYLEMEATLNRKRKVERQEFLEFFTDYFIKNLNNDSVSTNLKLKIIVVLTFLIWSAYNQGENVKEDTLNKLRSINTLYNEFLSSRKTEENDNVIKQFTEFIAELNKNLNEYFPAKNSNLPSEDKGIEKEESQKPSEDSTSNEELLTTLQEKTRELAKLKKVIKKLEKQVRSLSDSLSERKKENSILTKENQSYENKLNGAKSEKIRLSGEITKLTQKIGELEAEIARLNCIISSSIKEKGKLKEIIQEKEAENERLEQILLEFQRKENKRFLDVQTNSSSTVFDEEIKKAIITIISKNKSTIGDIINGLRDRGYHLSRKEIKEYLNEIKRTININIEDDYSGLEVERPSIELNRTFNIPILPNTRCIDLLAVSDFHISCMDSNTIKDLDRLNEYCAKQGIGIILNGGDFFSFKGYKKDKRHVGMSCWQQLVEKTILDYPYDENIIHLVLGGNHDRESISGGIDAIRTLAKERIDFAYLGYGSARITFNGSVSKLNSLGIHHPNKRYENPVGDYSYSTEQLQRTINSLFIRNNETRDTYLDLVGHIHKSGLDMENGICIIPSYMKDRVANGAWHLKVYFDESGNISNIVLIPLIKRKELEKITEINYVKKLVK